MIFAVSKGRLALPSFSLPFINITEFALERKSFRYPEEMALGVLSLPYHLISLFRALHTAVTRNALSQSRGGGRGALSCKVQITQRLFSLGALEPSWFTGQCGLIVSSVGERDLPVLTVSTEHAVHGS